MSSHQKFGLAFKTAIDPVTLGIAAVGAGMSQALDLSAGYGQGAEGYGKRVGASYAGQADSLLWGNAILPSLLHQDPRYFRKKTGTFKSRLLYALSATVKSKNDDGSRGPNYSNVIGRMIAAGISNVYYPPGDRGVGPTFGRAATLISLGTLGSVLNEFWPDIRRKLFNKQN